MIRLEIGPEISDQMEKDMILAQDLEEVISNAEETGMKIVDDHNHSFIARKKIGAVTYWAEYRLTGDAAQIIKAYSHRMSLEMDK